MVVKNTWGTRETITATDFNDLSTQVIASTAANNVRETFMDCKVWYVDGSTGNNSNSGILSSPMLTIAAAITAAGDSNPVLIRCANITSINLVNIKRHNRLHIMPTNLASPPAALQTAELSGCRAVDIRGFNVIQEIALGGIDNQYGDAAMGCVDCVIAGNKVGPYTGAAHWAGIEIENQSRRCVVANNEITGLLPATGTIAVPGIHAYGTGSPEGVVGNGTSMGWNHIDLSIVGNYIHDVGEGCVLLGYFGGLVVENNFVTNCHRPAGANTHVDAFQIGGGPNIVMRGNAIWDTPGSGGGIFMKEDYNNINMLIENNTIVNMQNDNNTNQSGNGLTLYNAPGVRVWNNIVWKTMGMTVPASSQGGGLWLFAGTEFQDIPNNELRPNAPIPDAVIYRNILDKIRFEGGATASYRNNNWINDPNGNGSQGYNAALGDLTAGVGTGISTTQVDQLCTFRTTTRLAQEWRRDPFAFWGGPPGARRL